MNILFLSLLVIFSGSLLSFVVTRLFRNGSPWILALIPVSVFATFVIHAPAVLSGNPLSEQHVWVAGLDFNLDFYLDGLSLLFALLITGIGALIVIYGGVYLANDKNRPRFYAFLFLFMGAMLGIVLSDNVFSLFVFWELTSLSSYLLIGYKHGDEGSRKSALQALLVTAFGGLALMGGMLLASMAAGSPVISEWLPGENTFVEYKHFSLMLTLILIGAFTKSAQFPFHFWLPNAMAAPTPVSAYLHSATMVKAGVYLLARLNPHFFMANEWHYTLVIVGAATIITGAVWALFQSDLKKILAYTTVSALGILVFAIGIGTPKAIQGAMIFLLAHALYKGALFMLAGNIDSATKTRDVRNLNGLFKSMRYSAFATVIASLSMAGFPFMLGFISKELLYESTLFAPSMSVWLTLVLFVSGTIFAAIAMLLGYKIFFGRSDNNRLQKIYEVSPGMFIGPVILGACSLVAGVLPQATIGSLVSAASLAVSPSATIINLQLWHGFTIVLGISVFTLLSGWVLYYYLERIRKIETWLPAIEKFGPESLYDNSWKYIIRFGESVTAIVQSGYLRYYIMTILVTLFSLAFLTMRHYQLYTINTSLEGVDVYEVLLALLVIASLFFIIISGSRLAAIAILGVAGYGVAVFYAMYGAIDLAMTQFLIETITVVVFVYVLYKLPEYIKFSTSIYHFRDAVIAISGGAAMTFIILLITNYPLTSELKLFYAQNSYLMAKGRNVVNVILVDFRALDTLGELVVLFIAALGIFALNKLRIQKNNVKEE